MFLYRMANRFRYCPFTIIQRNRTIQKNNFSSYKNILEKLFEISLHIDATTNITKLIHFLITLPKNLTFNIVGNMEEVPNYGELFSYLDHCSSPKNLLCSYKNIIALQPIFAHNFFIPDFC